MLPPERCHSGNEDGATGTNYPARPEEAELRQGFWPSCSRPDDQQLSPRNNSLGLNSLLVKLHRDYLSRRSRVSSESPRTRARDAAHMSHVRRPGVVHNRMHSVPLHLLGRDDSVSNADSHYRTSGTFSEYQRRTFRNAWPRWLMALFFSGE